MAEEIYRLEPADESPLLQFARPETTFREREAFWKSFSKNVFPEGFCLHVTEKASFP
jgi:hypothetical protein